MADIEKIRETLIKVCDNHLEKGGEILAGNNHWCPLGIYLQSQSRNPSDSMVAFKLKIQETLGLSLHESSLFMEGFDNSSKNEYSYPYYCLGQEFRKKYLSEE